MKILTRHRTGMGAFLALLLFFAFSCIPVSGLYIWNVNDPDSCPLEAEIGESIIIRGDPPPQENVVKDPYNATDEQKQLCSELRGSDITMGEFLRIVYPHLWNGLSPEDQKMYDSYMKAWGAVDPIPLPPWHEPWEAAPSSNDATQSNVGDGPDNYGLPSQSNNPFLSNTIATNFLERNDLAALLESHTGISTLLTSADFSPNNFQRSNDALSPQIISTFDNGQLLQQIGSDFHSFGGDLIRNHMAG